MLLDGRIEDYAPKYDLQNSKADRLRYLADFIGGLRDDEISMPYYDCGTAKCALGWAVTLPAFTDLGAAFHAHDFHFGAMAFFEITCSELEFIAMYDSYPEYGEHEIPARAVADHIHEVADKVAEREHAKVEG